MVEQIYDTDKLKEERFKGYMVTIQLTQEEIKEWKSSGKFAHLKKELVNLPKLKFACTQVENGDCIYYFITSTMLMEERITTMLSQLLYNNEKLPLVKCAKSSSAGFNPCIEGSTQVCTLF